MSYTINFLFSFYVVVLLHPNNQSVRLTWPCRFSPCFSNFLTQSPRVGTWSNMVYHVGLSPRTPFLPQIFPFLFSLSPHFSYGFPFFIHFGFGKYMDLNLRILSATLFYCHYSFTFYYFGTWILQHSFLCWMISHCSLILSLLYLHNYLKI